MKSTPLSFDMRMKPTAVSHTLLVHYISLCKILLFCFLGEKIVLKCDPRLSGTTELVYELNKSNGLFKFVRTMRERFQQAAAQGMYLYLSYISCIDI